MKIKYFVSTVCVFGFIFLLAVLFYNLGYTRSFYGSGIAGDGNVVTKKYDFADQQFNSIKVWGEGKVYVNVASVPGVASAAITTDSNLLPHIEIYVKNNTLYIRSKDNVQFSSLTKKEVTINVSELRSFITHGSCDSFIRDVQAEKFSVGLYGSGGVVLYGHTHYLSMSIHGSGDMDSKELAAEIVDVSIHGSGDAIVNAAKKLMVEIHGSGEMYSKDLAAEIVDVSIYGSGGAIVNAAKKLMVKIHGSGVVKYYGNPQEVESSVHGSGKIVRYKK